MLIKLFFRIKQCIQNNIFCKVLKPFAYFVYRFIMWLYGASIPLNSKLEDIPVFPHGLYGIFISGGASIGKNVTIFQHVTIGSVHTKGSKHIGAPTIGANVVVFENIPDNYTVVVERPRIINRAK
jgi:serine O-acetyltransferase